MTLDEISDGCTTSTDMDCASATSNKIISHSHRLPQPQKSVDAHIYKLQKRIEHRCRTISYLTTSDIMAALEEALDHCESAKNTLLNSAIIRATS